MVATSKAARHALLLAASLLFYGWWDLRFVPLLILQVSATWFLALLHEKRRRPVWLDLGIVLNLLSLGIFKYLNFLLTAIADVTRLAMPHADILLPIGISF